MAEILHQLRSVVYPIIYQVLYIPGEPRKTKTAWLSIESCLINRDPYGMVYEIIPI